MGNYLSVFLPFAEQLAGLADCAAIAASFSIIDEPLSSLRCALCTKSTIPRQDKNQTQTQTQLSILLFIRCLTTNKVPLPKWSQLPSSGARKRGNEPLSLSTSHVLLYWIGPLVARPWHALGNSNQLFLPSLVGRPKLKGLVAKQKWRLFPPLLCCNMQVRCDH